MKVLALDTSGSTCSVAIVSLQAIIGEYTINNGLNHSVSLMPMVNSLLTSTNYTISDIDLIAYASGPGSFTGLRIGATTAKALAHAHKIPVTQVPTLNALAYNITEENVLIVPIIDARRGQVYTSYFVRDKQGIVSISQRLVINIQTVITQVNELLSSYNYTNAIFLGDGVNVHSEILKSYTTVQPNNCLQRASSVGFTSLLLSSTTYQNASLEYVKKPLAVKEMGKITIQLMVLQNVDDVHKIELGSFSKPWSKEQLVSDLSNNTTVYLVAIKNGEVVGYIGMWHIVDEGHITNVAVHLNYRQEGIGTRLLQKLEEIAKEKEIVALTLEVRKSNVIAQGLYEKHGFKNYGMRKDYYKSPKEDAIIMWKALSNINPTFLEV